MSTKQEIIEKYLHNRWYKKTLIISSTEPEYASKIHSLNVIYCSGYLDIDEVSGCKFDIASWPFSYHFFDLIILDHTFFNNKMYHNF